MKKHLWLSLAALTLLLQGCAFTTAHLDIAARPDANFKGPLSEVPPKTFEIKPLTDVRPDQARIGYKKNGYGSNTADILSNRPVTDILVDAVTQGLRKNGHNVGTPSDIVVTGSVTRFWFESKQNFWTIEFTGNVECDLDFVSVKTGKSIYKARYSGTYTDKTAGGLEATWTEVMDASVEKFVEDAVFDTNLVNALQEAQAVSAN